MSYDQRLADRVRSVLSKHRGVTERKMFGGLAFMVNDRMCCGVLNRSLVVRVGKDRYQEALARPHVRPMDFTGRPMRGLVYVGPGGSRSTRTLKAWIQQGLYFVRATSDSQRRRH